MKAINGLAKSTGDLFRGFLDLVQPQDAIDRGNRAHQRAGAKVCSCSRMNLRNQTEKGTAWTRQEVV